MALTRCQSANVDEEVRDRVSEILESVRNVEALHTDDDNTLCNVYREAFVACRGVGVLCPAPTKCIQDYEIFQDFSVNYMRLLCKLHPEEARAFYDEQNDHLAKWADARIYEARASMEARLENKTIAIQILREGLRVGAQPAEMLERRLSQFQSHPDIVPSGSPNIVRTSSTPVRAKLRCVPLTPALTPSMLTPGGSSRSRRIVRPLLDLGCPKRSLDVGDLEEDSTEVPSQLSGHDGDQEHLSQQTDCKHGDRDDIHDHSVESRNETTGRTSSLRAIQEAESSSQSLHNECPLRGESPAAVAIHDSRRCEANCHDVVAVHAEMSPCVGLAGAPQVSEHKTVSEHKKVISVNGKQYLRLHTLGKGGTSKVFLVQGPTGERFALKRVVADNAKQLEAYQNEVVLLNKLRHQKHVIQVMDSEIDHERRRILIVMEVGDMDLARYIQSDDLTLEKIQDIWRQMLEAVQVIHAERIVHADLKPQNLILVGDCLKVIDFGIAKQISQNTTNIMRDTPMGTPSYMAPESINFLDASNDVKMGRAADIWSLGIILYQIVFRSPPFPGIEPMQRLIQLNDPKVPIPFPRNHRLHNECASTQAHLVDVLSSCLQRDPGQRPSLSKLLSHAFLQRTMVRRSSADALVDSIVSTVLQAVGETRGLEEGQMSALQQEVWHRLSGSVPGNIGDCTAVDPLQRLLRQGCVNEKENLIVNKICEVDAGVRKLDCRNKSPPIYLR